MPAYEGAYQGPLDVRGEGSRCNCHMPFDGKRMFWGGFKSIVNL